MEAFSYAFQLAGALILLVNCFPDAMRAKIVLASIQHIKLPMHEDGNITVSKEELQKNATKAYLNICSFLDLTIGYFLAIVASPLAGALWTNVAVVVFITVAIIGLEILITNKIAKVAYKSDTPTKLKNSKLEAGDFVFEVIHHDQL